MGSTFAGLEIGKRSLFAQRSALTTINHNVANANTPGYTRQRVNMVATTAFPPPSLTSDRNPGQVGTGVFVSSIERLREQYLDRQFRSENTNYGFWDGQSNILERIETILMEPSETGLQTILDKFWESWQDLSKNPESLSARQIVTQRGLTVAETFRQLSGSLDALKKDTESIIMDKIDQVNQYAEQIRNINEQISRIQPHGYAPNDLMDQRDLFIDKLSKLADIMVTPSHQGMINLSIGGQPLVNGKEPSQGITTTTVINGGELSALKAAIEPEGLIERFTSKLDLMANSLGTEINRIHQSGIDLDGQQGITFFSNVSDARSIKIDDRLLSAPNRVSAALQPLKGDGDAANAIAKLKFGYFNQLGTDVTLDQYYRLTISQLGVETQESKRFMGNSDAAKLAIDNRRQSISGVSLDEEMSEMIKYQHAYNAASRSINSVDEMLDKLINGTGRVGL